MNSLSKLIYPVAMPIRWSKLAVTNASALVRPAPAALGEVVDVMLLPLAEDDALHPQSHELGQDFPDQLDALLLHQPGHLIPAAANWAPGSGQIFSGCGAARSPLF